GCGHQRQPLALHTLTQVGQGRPPLLGVQFLAVPGGELVELLRVVSVPFAQCGGGCDVLVPGVDVGVLLAHATRPHAVHEHPCAVVVTGFVVYPLQHNIHTFRYTPRIVCRRGRTRWNPLRQYEARKEWIPTPLVDSDLASWLPTSPVDPIDPGHPGVLVRAAQAKGAASVNREAAPCQRRVPACRLSVRAVRG